MKKVILFLMIFLLSAVPCTVLAEEGVTVSLEHPTPDYNKPFSDEFEVAAIGEAIDVKAKSAILIEPVTKRVLYELNGDEQLAPASITKIMSLLLIMEALEDKKFTLDTVISASEHACSMGGSQIWLEPGEEMTVDELLRAVVIASANDATVALGEAVAGSEEGFVGLMNEKAKVLGMNETTFINCTGLDAEGHLTSAKDVAIMSAELIKHELIKEYSTVWMDTLRDGKSELVNTNRLVRFYSGAFGLKTGTTSKAGSCLSAAAERDGLCLIAVVMGSPTSNDRFNGARKLLDFGFANYSYNLHTPDNSKLWPIRVKNGTVRYITAKAEENLPLLIKKGDTSKISEEIELPESLNAPIKSGDTVGYIHVKYDGQEIGQIPIRAELTSQRQNVWFCLIKLYRKLFSL